MSKKIFKFPEGFLWGTATASYQVEGNNSLSAWWDWEQQGKIKNGEKSGIAIDHYNRYEEDFKFAQSLGQNIHRLSVEWSRIEPEKGVFDDQEMFHYVQVVKSLKEKGFKVMVTLFHFSVPVWFAKAGGFENRKAISWFLEFVRYTSNYLGSYVDFWITINELTIYAAHGYLRGASPPGKKSAFKTIKIINRLIDLHKETYFALHSMNKNSIVGINHDFAYIEAYNKNSILDKLVAKATDYLGNTRVINKIMPYCDFFGVDYYLRMRMKFHIGGTYLGVADEFGLFGQSPDIKRKSDVGWEIYPLGLYKNLMSLKKYDKPIIITENGLADAGDTMRNDFIIDHLIALHKAMTDGVNVFGYIHWTLIDNFEWDSGWGPKFGLVAVDRENGLKRLVKPSGKFFAQICKNNGFEVSD